MTAFGTADAQRAAEWIRSRTGARPHIALVLGSGLAAIADGLESRRSVAFADVPGFPGTSVAGHTAQIISGSIGQTTVLVFAGRVHQYEGHSPQAAGFPVRVAHALGARALVLTNAAGGIRESLASGDLVIVDDHINLSFRNPLIGTVEDGDLRFPDVSSPYDRELSDALADAVASTGARCSRGTYACVPGPSYETPAEIRMLRTLGADVVGMSTVPEVLVARACGMRVAAVSLVTNMASGLSKTPLTHDEVLATSDASIATLRAAFASFVSRGTGKADN